MNATFDGSAIRFSDLALVRNVDAHAALVELADGSVDAIVTDPPYAIRAPKPSGGGTEVRSMSQSDRVAEWDAYAASDMLGQQSANWHDKATHSRGYADNDPFHFQRWCELWLLECLRVLRPGGHLVAFGGTRTWHRLATAAENVGFEIRDSLAWMYATGFPKSLNVGAAVEQHRAKRPDADNSRPSDAEWVGWGTTLKPAFEPIVFARAPLEGGVAANVLLHGTGAINVDGTRLAGHRWPTNVFLDESQAAVLDASFLALGGSGTSRPSQFFWHAKPGPIERRRVAVDGVKHPTLKPVALMRELVRLVTPPGGIVLDPFAGSGTTVEASLLEGMRCIAFEREAIYIPLIQARIEHVSGTHGSPTTAVAPDTTDVLF